MLGRNDIWDRTALAADRLLHSFANKKFAGGATLAFPPAFKLLIATELLNDGES